MEVVGIIISSLIIIIGWRVNNHMSAKRAISDDKRKIITSHLIDAYRVLVNDVSHRAETKERNLKLESVIGAIQLFGNKKQILLTKQLADEVAAGDAFQLDPLINSLRDSLRESLDLEPVQGNVRWLRFFNTDSHNDQNHSCKH